MRKRVRTIWTAVTVVLILGALYAYMSFGTVGQNHTGTVRSLPFLEPLVSVDAASIHRVTLDGVATVIFERDGDGFRAVQPSVDHPRLRDNTVSRLFQAAARIAPDVLVHDPSAVPVTTVDLYDYRLDAPTVVTADLVDGSRFALELGGWSPAGRIYARTPTDGRIWTLSAWGNELFLYDFSEFRDRSLPLVNTRDLALIRIVTREFTINVERGGDNEHGLYLGDYRITSPYALPLPVDAENLSQLMEQLQPFSIVSFVDEAASFSSFGLAEPDMELILRDSNQEFHLMVGGEVPGETGSVYARLASTPAVFALDASSVSFARAVDPFSLVSKLPIMVHIDSVDRVTINHAGRQRVLSIERNPLAGSDGSETTELYLGNGSPMAEATFRNAYQAMIGLAIEADLPTRLRPTAGSMPELTINFQRNGNHEDLTYSLFGVSRDFMAFNWDADLWFAVSVSQVERAMAHLDRLIPTGQH